MQVSDAPVHSLRLHVTCALRPTRLPPPTALMQFLLGKAVRSALNPHCWWHSAPCPPSTHLSTRTERHPEPAHEPSLHPSRSLSQRRERVPRTTRVLCVTRAAAPSEGSQRTSYTSQQLRPRSDFRICCGRVAMRLRLRPLRHWRRSAAWRVTITSLLALLLLLSVHTVSRCARRAAERQRGRGWPAHRAGAESSSCTRHAGAHAVSAHTVAYHMRWGGNVQGGGVRGAHAAARRSRMDATTETVAYLAGLVSPQPSACGAPHRNSRHTLLHGVRRRADLPSAGVGCRSNTPMAHDCTCRTRLR